MSVVLPLYTMDENVKGGFCFSPFFDLKQTWNTTDPDFSSCFQQTVVTWTPCAFLVLVAPVYIYYLTKSQQVPIPLSVFSVTKTILSIVIALVCVADIIKSVQEYASNSHVELVKFISPLVVCLTMVLAVLLLHLERTNGVQSSGFMFIFWLLFVVADIFILQSKSRTVAEQGIIEDDFRFATFFISFALVLAQFILTFFLDGKKNHFSPSTGDVPCPEENATFLSRITFWWISGLVVKGYKHPLTRKDLYALNTEDTCSNVVPQFEHEWDKEVQKKKRLAGCNKNDCPAVDGIELRTTSDQGETYVEVRNPENKVSPKAKLITAFLKTYWSIIVLSVFYKLIYDIFQFVLTLLLKLVINFTQDKSEFSWRGYFYASVMFVACVVQSLILHQYFHKCFLLGMYIRSSLIACIYKKMVRLSSAARRMSTVGEIVNLMSVDAQRIMDLMTYIHTIWSGPFQIGLALYFLWQTLGPSIMAGTGVMLIMIPINVVVAKKTKDLQMKQMQFKDARIKAMNEILNGIKVLKLYAWEESFEKQVLDIRNKELTQLKKMAILNAIVSFTWTTAPFFVSLVTFAVYIYSDENNILDAEKAFVSLALFNILKFPLSMLPQIISSMVQVSVSIKRLQNFLNSEELDPTTVTQDSELKYAVSMEKCCFTWDRDSPAPTLHDISVNVDKGSLVAVVGQVGSGKSSFLSAILGEMERTAGSAKINGSVAYVAQQAWIQNSTLQNNILFGKPLAKDQYEGLLDACALRTDLDILPAGDLTEIGEKGINLSGGQKQRVSLARAVYSDADIYLLDDPLSAVDAHVGKHIFNEVIGPNGLLKNKTRVLVTHGIGFLPKVDRIIVLVDGKVSEAGSFTELVAHAGAFAEFLKNYLRHEMEETDDLDEEEVEELKAAEDIVSNMEIGSPALQRQVSEIASYVRTVSMTSASGKDGSTTSLPSSLASHSLSGSRTSLHKVKANKAQDDIQALKKQVEEKTKEDRLIKDETMETGKVARSVFLAYLAAIGPIITVSIIIFYVLFNVASVYANVWLSQWSNDDPYINGTLNTDLRDLRIGVYGGLGVLQAVFILFAPILLYIGNVVAGRTLHLQLLGNILASPMVFFDTTPLGRIINRFSKDIDVLDSVIPRNFESWLACFLRVVSVPVVIGYSTPWFLVMIVPLGLLYFLIQRFYVSTSRQLKRLESVSRSPIYSHFGETVTGVSTIRAYRQEQRFILDSEEKVDENNMSYFLSIVCNRWLAVRLEFVANCIVFFATLFAVIGRDHLSAGSVGLSITYALSVTQTLNWLVRMTCELETNIVAVERVKEYSETPTEAARVVKDPSLPEGWPEKGQIEFINYSTRYREGLDLVLKDFNCTILPCQKVGIVGRTGAGKSSLTLGLFRIIERAGGKILIDGVDIATIGLRDLRSRITIIPQDPVLFSGTLRMNLDPLDQHTDEEVWRALEHSHLKKFVNSLPKQLQHECSEGGENISVGQRQLVCLGRALLRKTRLLVLDEATAAVDLETDDLIQATIRSEFSNCTILTIAHRLNTIMDYTRILVVDAGSIKEYDAPHELLKKEDSLFYGMAKDAGLV